MFVSDPVSGPVRGVASPIIECTHLYQIKENLGQIQEFKKGGGMPFVTAPKDRGSGGSLCPPEDLGLYKLSAMEPYSLFSLLILVQFCV